MKNNAKSTLEGKDYKLLNTIQNAFQCLGATEQIYGEDPPTSSIMESSPEEDGGTILLALGGFDPDNFFLPFGSGGGGLSQTRGLKFSTLSLEGAQRVKFVKVCLLIPG